DIYDDLCERRLAKMKQPFDTVTQSTNGRDGSRYPARQVHDQALQRLDQWPGSESESRSLLSASVTYFFQSSQWRSFSSENNPGRSFLSMVLARARLLSSNRAVPEKGVLNRKRSIAVPKLCDLG